MTKKLTQETEIELLKQQVVALDKKLDETDKRNCLQHEEIKGEVKNIATLVSKAMAEKADKKEVDTLGDEVNKLKTDSAVNNWKIGLIAGIITAVASIILNYLVDKLP